MVKGEGYSSQYGVSDFTLRQRPQGSDFLIDIICHARVLLFLVVAMRSQKSLKKNNEAEKISRNNGIAGEYFWFNY